MVQTGCLSVPRVVEAIKPGACTKRGMSPLLDLEAKTRDLPGCRPAREPSLEPISGGHDVPQQRAVHDDARGLCGGGIVVFPSKKGAVRRTEPGGQAIVSWTRSGPGRCRASVCRTGPAGPRPAAPRGAGLPENRGLRPVRRRSRRATGGPAT